MGELYLALAIVILIISGALVLWDHKRRESFNRAHDELLLRFEEVTGRSSAEAMAENIAKKYQMSNNDIERQAGYLIESALEKMEGGNDPTK